MSVDGFNIAEYQALTADCGFVPLAMWTVVSLGGDDRQTFLHNMCTNDIKALAPAQSCEAFCTDVKGKIIAHVFVHQEVERTWLLTVPDQAERIITHLDRYIIREDVQLIDESETSDLTLVAGAKSVDMLAQLSSPEFMQTLLPLSGRFGFLVKTASAATDEFHNQLASVGAVACGDAAWQSLRVEAGLPLFGVDFSGKHLPQEVSRDRQAINFNKGCYLGQETVARLDALGHVNKQLVTIRFATEDAIDSGVPLSHNEKQVGEATSVAASYAVGATLGLAMVRHEANAVGTLLDSPVGQAEVISTATIS